MDLSIIIVSWRVKELLRENLRAIFDNTEYVDFEVFVVDNNSGDGTVEMVSREFPKVTILANNNNVGFAKANNQGIEMARGNYVLLLNPDMKVFPGTLRKMVDWMDENHNVGVGGCKLVNDKGEIVPQVRKFPSLLDQLAIVLKMPHIFPAVLDKYLCRDFNYETASRVDSIRGSFFMIRGEAINSVGMLDTRYFLWFEEVDFCKRLDETAWDVYYNPSVKCIDRVGKSFVQVKVGKTQKYFRDSMLKYFWKWHPKWQWFVLWLAWPVGMLGAIIFNKPGKHRKIT